MIYCDLSLCILIYFDDINDMNVSLVKFLFPMRQHQIPHPLLFSALRKFSSYPGALEECNDSQSKALLAAGSRPGTGQKGDRCFLFPHERFHLGSIQKKSVRMLHPNGNVNIDTLELVIYQGT